MADDDYKKHDLLSHFFVEHAPLINLHVKKARADGKIPHGIEDDDLHIAGIHGLMDAVKRYDPNSDADFTTYAGSRVRGKMLDLAHSWGTNPIPKSIRRAAKEFKAGKKTYVPGLGVSLGGDDEE